MSFSNTTIDSANLPTVEQEDFLGLSPTYLKGLLLKVLLWGVLGLSGLGVLHSFQFFQVLGAYVWLPFVFWVIVVLGVFLFHRKVFFRKGYYLRERDIVYREGLWWTKETVVPFVRVQHSEVTQAPLGRLFGYSTLKLYTAGGSKSDLSIPALLPTTAKKLENFISRKTNVDDGAEL